jgi:hypothetical protein
MTPKEYKQMMDYLTRSGIKDKVKFASDVARPNPKPRVQEIDAINAFMKRNPRADGGRIPFDKGGDFAIALENLVKDKDTNFKTIQQIFDKTNTPRTGATERVFNKYRDQFKIEKTSALSFGKKQNIHTPQTFQKILGKAGRKEAPEAYKAIIDALEKAGIEYTPPESASAGGTATFNNVTKETIDIFNKEATKLRAKANLPMSRYQTKQLKKDIKIFVKDKLAKGEYVSRPTIKEHFGLTEGRGGDMLITRSLGVNEKANTGLLKKLGQEEKKVTAKANFAKATAATMETKNDVLKIINDEFRLDPDLSNSEDLAKTIYGDQFPKGNINDLPIEDLRKAESLVRQTDNDVMTYLKVIKGLRDKPDGMRLPTQNVINDITDNILSGIEDESGDGQSFRKKGFRFSSGLLRDYKIAIINANLGLDPGTYKSQRDKLVLKNKNLDEIFSLSALADIAPGYTTKVQSIKKLINMRKASEIDKPFQKIINALNEGKTSMDLKGKTVPIEDAIKDFNKTSLEFSKREKVQSPKINYNVKFDKSILDSYGKASQENIKQVYKDKKFFLSDINPKIKTKDILKTGTEGFIDLDLFRDVGRGAGAAFKALPTLAPTAALTAGFGVDPTSAIDRATLATEAAFAPGLVQQAAKFSPAVQRVLNLGLSPQLALRAARIASPLGIASLAAEGLYQAGKFSRDRIKELQAMTPEQRQELRRQGARQAFDPFSAAGGGLAKQAGDRSGKPPEKGPNSQGLPGLLKRVKKL